jgi:gas vesicle protein
MGRKGLLQRQRRRNFDGNRVANLNGVPGIPPSGLQTFYSGLFRLGSSRLVVRVLHHPRPWFSILGKDTAMKNQRIAAFTYLVGGLGFGAAAAGLLAPRSGAASRKLIRRKAQKAKRFVKKAIGDGNGYLTRTGTEVLKQATELIDRSKKTYRMAMTTLLA